MILIWAGLVFLAENLGWLDQIKFQQLEIDGITLTGMDTWAMLMISAGVIVFFEALIRTFFPFYRSSTGGNFFLAASSWGLVWAASSVGAWFSPLS